MGDEDMDYNLMITASNLVVNDKANVILSNTIILTVLFNLQIDICHPILVSRIMMYDKTFVFWAVLPDLTLGFLSFN